MKKKHASENVKPMDIESETTVNAGVDLENKMVSEEEKSKDEKVAFESKPSEVEKLKSELDEKNEVLLRTIAEYQNFRKRTEKEKSDIYKFANEKMILDLLPLMDNFERAISMFDGDKLDNFKEGIELIKKGLDDLFAKQGIVEIEAVGNEFDHNMHHAVMTGEAEGVAANSVIEVLQKGYTLNGKVIRPSMVKVTPHN